MTKKLLFVGLVLLVVALVALAADAITGKWGYEMEGRGGGPGRPVTLDLKADGATLTGTVTGMGGGGRGMRGGGGGGGGAAPGGGAPPAPTPMPISNGKVDGNNVTFEVSRDTQNGAMVTKFVGVVSGSEMKLKVTAPGRGGGDPVTTEVTAKKQ
jgi:hypothetical protein